MTTMTPTRTKPLHDGVPLLEDFYPTGSAIGKDGKANLYWDARGAYSSCIDVGSVPWSFGLRIATTNNYEAKDRNVDTRMWVPTDGPITVLDPISRWQGTVAEARKAHMAYVSDAAKWQISKTFDANYTGWIVWDIETSEPDVECWDNDTVRHVNMAKLANLMEAREPRKYKPTPRQCVKIYRDWQKEYYKTVITATREACPKAKVGFYGFGGLGYWQTQANNGGIIKRPPSQNAAYHSDRLFKATDWFYDLVDGIFPSCYLPYPSTDKCFALNGGLEAHNGYTEEQRKAWAAKYGVWASPNIDVDPLPDGSLRGFVDGGKTHYSHGLVTHWAYMQYFSSSIAHAQRLARRPSGKVLPVMPYVWMHYHDSNGLRGRFGPLLNDAEMRMIFELPLALGCQGVVLWDWLPQKAVGDADYQNCYDHADRMRLDMANRVNPYLANVY